jgi:hypothetical protein
LVPWFARANREGRRHVRTAFRGVDVCGVSYVSAMYTIFIVRRPVYPPKCDLLTLEGKIRTPRDVSKSDPGPVTHVELLYVQSFW